MRRDYVPTAHPDAPEAELVEEHWTALWEREAGPRGELQRIRRRDEYRAMAPYLARLPRGARVLDGGCGLGDWTLLLARDGFSVTGLDLSRATVAKLRARFPEADFVAGDVRRTGYPDAEFDAYLSWGVFEHFEAGLQDCVREAHRIVKPGGWLFVSVPLDNLRHAVRGALGRPRPDPGERQRFYQWRLTRAELARELELGGFQVHETRPIQKRHGLRRSLHQLFGMRLDGLPAKGLGALLAPLVPGSFVAHMVFAAARKPPIAGATGG